VRSRWIPVRIPAAGMQAALGLLDLHAHNIANASTPGFRAQRPDGGTQEPDLVTDVVGLITARTMYTANAKAFELMAETERFLLDVRA